MRTNRVSAHLLFVAICVSGISVQAGGPKAMRGVASDPQATDFLAASVSSLDPGLNAGMILVVDAQIEGIGKVVVSIMASWDWSCYTAAHPCALVNKVDSLPLINVLDFPSLITYSPIVMISTKKASIVGNITGGSVCEVEVPGSGGSGSINQWLIAFKVDPDASTGRFEGTTGQGVIDFKFDSGTSGAFVQPFQISLNLD